MTPTTRWCPPATEAVAKAGVTDLSLSSFSFVSPSEEREKIKRKIQEQEKERQAPYSPGPAAGRSPCNFNFSRTVNREPPTNCAIWVILPAVDASACPSSSRSTAVSATAAAPGPRGPGPKRFPPTIPG